MKYVKRKKYKYRLYNRFFYQVDIIGVKMSQSSFLTLTNGCLDIRKGYTWDGATDPAIDTANFMKASLVHDALYQLIREGVIDRDERNKCDKILQTICIQEGMSKIRAWFVYQGVKRFGGKATKSRVITV